LEEVELEEDDGITKTGAPEFLCVHFYRNGTEEQKWVYNITPTSVPFHSYKFDANMFTQETVDSLDINVSWPSPRSLDSISLPSTPSISSPRHIGTGVDDLDAPRLRPFEYDETFQASESESEDEALADQPVAVPEPATVEVNPRSRRRCWVFTLNNYTDEEELHFQTFGEDEVRAQYSIAYIIWGKEIATTGTLHFQGYVRFTKPIRFQTVKSILSNRIYLAGAREKPIVNQRYCRKQGDYQEFGDVGTDQGARNDYAAFVEDARENGGVSFDDQLTNHPRLSVQNGDWIQRVNAHVRPLPQVDSYSLYNWQALLYHQLQGPVDGRRIFCVKEPHGNCGKSWFARYYL